MDKARLERLLSPDTNRYRRAIELFEFQIGLVRSAKSMKRARIFAAMKLAEHLEKIDGIEPSSIVDAVSQSDDYRYVFKEAMARGWIGI